MNQNQHAATEANNSLIKEDYKKIKKSGYKAQIHKIIQKHKPEILLRTKTINVNEAKALEEKVSKTS